MAGVPPPEEGTVAVMVRVRPPTPSERAMKPILQVVDQHLLVFDPEEPSDHFRGPKPPGKELRFVFDRVFGEEATQEEVFQHTTCDILDSVLNGYNCSVFAYGATGAGKTYTMLGSEKSPGIMYLTMMELYKRIEARKEQKSCEVLVSYQEVYNEQIHDLLEPKGPLAIWEDPEKGAVVQGLSFHQPQSAEQLLEMLANGNRNRTQHPTDANATSSRSHAIFQVYVKQQDRGDGRASKLQVAKMSLIDLAGSERASVANTRGERLREGANINRSLLALINVINTLAGTKSKKTHVPYRDSKLTRLLKDSIGGNCRTIMVAAVSPSALACEDTYNTLKYASRAKEIKVSLKSNVLPFPSDDKHAKMCERLRAEVADLRARLSAYGEKAQGLRKANEALLASCTKELVLLPSLTADLLRVARQQYHLLKDNNLLTPSMASEFEELERRICQEAGASPEPAPYLTSRKPLLEASGATPAQEMPQAGDAPLAEVAAAVADVPATSAAPLGLQQLSPLVSPIRKRRRSSETRSASPSGYPRGTWSQVKRRRQRSSGREAEAPRALQSLGSPCPTVAVLGPSASPVPLCSTAEVTQGRVPLAPLATQNGCDQLSSPPRALNTTFEICKIGDDACGEAELAALDAVELCVQESVLNKQGGPGTPKTCIPVLASRASAIPRPSSVTKVPVLKRKRAESVTCPSQGGLRSCPSQRPGSSQRSAQPSGIPEYLPRLHAGKSTRRTTRTLPVLGRDPRAPTQPVKLLC